MDDLFIQLVLFAHVLGATVLVGTGAGIAFFMVIAHRSKDIAAIAHVSQTVVLADFVFTATAAILQPVTGYILAHNSGWPLIEGWILLSLLLYGLIGCFWLPVIAIQIRIRNLATEAATTNAALPLEYYRLYRIWFACGIPAFAAIMVIIWLMVHKPDIALL